MSRRDGLEVVTMADLVAGDVVHTEGMRVRLGEVIRFDDPNGRPWRGSSWSGVVLNLGEVLAAGNVPASFLPGGAWRVQSADWVEWAREVQP